MKNEPVSKYIPELRLLCEGKKKGQILLKTFYWSDKEQSCTFIQLKFKIGT